MGGIESNAGSFAVFAATGKWQRKVNILAGLLRRPGKGLSPISI